MEAFLWTAIAVCALAILILGYILIQNKVKTSENINSLQQKYIKTNNELSLLKDENEMLEQELKLIKNVYRSKLLKSTHYKDKVA